MRIACLKNHPAEGPGLIEEWARDREIAMEVIEAEALLESKPPFFDALIVMGGPMSVHDRFDDPKVAGVLNEVEKAFENEKPILGICLGAQMLAIAAGGEVVPGSQKEIGWYLVDWVSSKEPFFPNGEGPLVVFHWHGEQIVAPKGADLFARTEVCPVQAFRVGSHQWGLQFHLEVNTESVDQMAKAFSDEIKAGGAGVATDAEIRDGVSQHGDRCREILFRFLDQWKESW